MQKAYHESYIPSTRPTGTAWYFGPEWHVTMVERGQGEIGGPRKRVFSFRISYCSCAASAANTAPSISLKYLMQLTAS